MYQLGSMVYHARLLCLSMSMSSFPNLPILGQLLRHWANRPDLPMTHQSMAQSLHALLSYQEEEDVMTADEWHQFKELFCHLCIRYCPGANGENCPVGNSGSCAIDQGRI